MSHFVTVCLKQYFYKDETVQPWRTDRPYAPWESDVFVLDAGCLTVVTGVTFEPEKSCLYKRAPTDELISMVQESAKESKLHFLCSVLSNTKTDRTLLSSE